MKKNKVKPQDWIPKPCHEDWFAMSGDEQQRHCELCNTKVQNLTGMSYDDIISLKQANGGELCGAFHTETSSSVNDRSLMRPLLVSAGVASLSLASCHTKQPPVAGLICPPESFYNNDEQSKPTPDTPFATPPKPIEEKPPEKPEIVQPLPVLGKICRKS
ncbi:MAG: hypothetical protein ACSHX0_13715 [Akkermansiaceae bacterium]